MIELQGQDVKIILVTPAYNITDNDDMHDKYMSK